MRVADAVRFFIKGVSFVSRNSSCIEIKSIPRCVMYLWFPMFLWFPTWQIRRFGAAIQNELSFLAGNAEEIDASIRPSFMGGLLSLVLATGEIPGDIIELGTYRGGSSIMMARMLKRMDSKRRIFACDTFEGHPYEDKGSTTLNATGMFSDTSVPYLKKKLKQFDVLERITLVKGLFEKTLYSLLGSCRFSFAFVDCDLYDSTRFVLSFLAERMESGGVVAFHDYGWEAWGLSDAVHEWCRANAKIVRLHPVPHINFL